jgi:WD40 repeat protein
VISPGRILTFAALLVAGACVVLATSTASPSLAQEGDIGLPPQYSYEIVYRPPITGLSGIVASHDGTLYVRHLGPTGGARVSQLDVDVGAFTADVVDVPSGTSVSSIVGGPEDTVFVSVDGEFRQVSPDGSYEVWGTISPAGLPAYYTQDDHMFGISSDGTGVVELFDNGSYHTLRTGLGQAYDLVAATEDAIFVSDIGAGELIHLTTTGTYTVVATIAQDNTELAFDRAGDLYVNNAEERFARFDLVTGLFTEMTALNAACPVIRSPAGVAFDDSDRAVFGAWADNMITWADLSIGDGGLVIPQPWSNSNAADIGPDDALYLGVSGCGTSPSSQIERFTADGSHSTFLDGLVGGIYGLAFDPSGGLYVSLATESSSGVYFVPQGTVTPTLVPDSANADIGQVAVHPLTGHVFGYGGKDPADPSVAVLVEFSAAGKVDEYHFEMPKEPMEVLPDFAPDGTLYAFATEKERFMTGPMVERWILRLDLSTEKALLIAQVDRVGCCPMGSFSVDSSGYIWWVLNPDFLLYQISPSGRVKMFGENLPVDAGYVNRNSDGDIFLNSPDGLYRLWIWATQSAYVPLALR